MADCVLGQLHDAGMLRELQRTTSSDKTWRVGSLRNDIAMDAVDADALCHAWTSASFTHGRLNMGYKFARECNWQKIRVPLQPHPGIEHVFLRCGHNG